MARKQKSVASVSSGGGFTIGASDVIRWGDVMTIQGFDIKVSKAVELGIKHKIKMATMLKKDLKSKTGLLITFPMAMLMSDLQEKIGSGEKVLAMVKP